MKTLVLAVSFILGTTIAANATTVSEKVNFSNNEAIMVIDSVQQVQNGFVAVQASALSVKVQTAIKAFATEYTVKELAYDKAKTLTKVTLVSKKDKTEKVVILNEEGQEVK